MYRATAPDLLDMLCENGSRLNAIHISAAFVTLARSTKPAKWQQSEGFQALLRRTQEVPDLSAQCCANVIWSLAKLAYKPGSTLLVPLFAAAEREVGHFWPRNLANVLWACARLRCGSGGPSSGFLRPAVQQLAAVAPQLTPVELANSLWAMARMRLPRNERVLGMLAAAAEPQLSRWKPQDIANALWAFAEFDYQPPGGLVEALACAPQESLERFKPDELAMSLRSIARLSASPDATSPLWRQAAGHLSQNAKELRPERVADAVQAFAEFPVGTEAGPTGQVPQRGEYRAV
ncbi:unnamed protein product [Effrenium voratum]|nr:unnamed protein product [Effrenium voratum]